MMTSPAADYRARLGLEFTPSHFQVAVFDDIENGRGHRVVKAVAGAGKSRTIKAGAKLLACPGLFLAFGKRDADSLAADLAGTKMSASTVHAHGRAAIHRAVGYPKVDGNKYKDMVKGIRKTALDYGELDLGRDGTRNLRRDELKSIDEDGFPTSAINSLLEKARLNLLDPRDDDFALGLLDLANHHNVDTQGIPDMIASIIAKLMTWGWDNPRIIDYADMVWLPVANGYRTEQYSRIFVDECQDLNRAQLALIQKSILPGGRILFVGDPSQAIYGFCGADADSFQRIVDWTGQDPLPLSVCYRCPTSVLDLARRICPQIEARPGAPEGIVRSSTTDDFVATAKAGDVVLCRMNAPLLPIAFSLIAEGVSAAVLGRNIGEGLVKTVKKCAKGLRNFADGFSDRLDEWATKEADVARYRYKDEDALALRIETIGDQAECIRVIWSRSGAKTTGDLVRAIEGIFSDDNKTSVTLSSIHKAKGGQWDRVFIAMPERLGVARANAKSWMIEQEKNLEYVVITRAIKELVFLDGGVSEVEGDDDPTTDDETDAVEDIVTDPPTPLASFGRTARPQPPAALPTVDADAPDTYHPASRPSRVALARMLDAALRGQGFTAARTQARETVYTMTLVSGRECLVYSTIVDGACRGLGEDSIKVCLVESVAGKRRGVGKARRVNRVGKLAAIVGRVQSRISSLRK